MISLWDLYLDADDAGKVMEAAALLEGARAVREPLPLEDATLLHDRLTVVSRLSAEDAYYWYREAEDRGEAAQVDGGRWGSPAWASRMADVARELAASSQRIAEVAQAAADDLAPRLADRPVEVLRDTMEATARQAQELLRRNPDDAD